MSRRISPVAFAVVFCLAYPVVFALDWPLFLYYPLDVAFSWGPRVRHTEPAMAWYGLVASAGLIALVAALLPSDRWVSKKLCNRLWLFPCATMLACLYLLRQFFIA